MGNCSPPSHNVFRFPSSGLYFFSQLLLLLFFYSIFYLCIILCKFISTQNKNNILQKMTSFYKYSQFLFSITPPFPSPPLPSLSLLSSLSPFKARSKMMGLGSLMVLFGRILGPIWGTYALSVMDNQPEMMFGLLTDIVAVALALWYFFFFFSPSLLSFLKHFSPPSSHFYSLPPSLSLPHQPHSMETTETRLLDYVPCLLWVSSPRCRNGGLFFCR